MKQQYTHVIWDFNGTILDDIKASIDAINVMLAQRHLPVVASLDAYRAKFGFPVEEYYRYLGFDFEKEDYRTVLAPMWLALYEEHSVRSPIFEGVLPLNRAIKAAGLSQSVLSAAESTMLKRQLLERGLLDAFDEVWGTDSIHATGKLALAKAWRTAHPDARAVVIGDTVHDYETAQLLGADCVLVAQGCQSRERLLSCGVPVVNSLSECLPLILPCS